MKYYVTTDGRGYVLTIQRTGTAKDFVELDLSKYDLEKKRAYKLGHNELIFDEEEWERICRDVEYQADMKELAELKQYLEETDHYSLRAWEEVMTLTNPLTWATDALKITIKYTKEYKVVLAKRVAAWKRIDELEEKWK